MINVLVVDDQNLSHRIIESNLKSDSEIEIVGFAENGEEAVAIVPRLQPDIILMDLEMPKMDGLAATEIIAQMNAKAKILILTSHDNEQSLSKAIRNGARGYLLKHITDRELKNAIHLANQGYFQLSAELTERYLQKIISTNSQSAEITEIEKKLGHLQKSFAKLDKERKHYTSNLEDRVRRAVKDIIQKQSGSSSDRDSHLQFKIDRMKYNQERLAKTTRNMFVIQLVCLAAVLLIIWYLVFISPS